MEELLKEALHEITAKPVLTAIEFLQFGILVFILGYFAVPRLLGAKLRERKERVTSEVERADRVDEEYAVAEKEAKSIVLKAKKDARDIVRLATEKAENERKEALAEVERESKEILEHAGQTVETENNKVIAETSERLTNLVTVATRRFLDEVLTESERRDLTHKLILASLEGIDEASLHSGKK